MSEVKKPKKMTISDHVHIYKPTEIAIYNQAIDNYEKFLPSEGEIVSIIKKSVVNCGGWEIFDLAKALAKRLGR